MEVAVSATEVNPNFIFNNVPYDLWQPSLSLPPPNRNSPQLFSISLFIHFEINGDPFNPIGSRKCS